MSHTFQLCCSNCPLVPLLEEVPCLPLTFSLSTNSVHRALHLDHYIEDLMMPTAIPSTSYLPFFWFNPRFPDCLGRPFNLQAPYATVASATKKGSGIATRYLSIEMIESSNSWFTWWNVREKPFHANTPVGKYSSVAVSPPLSTHLNMFPHLIHLRFSGRQSPIGTARHDKQRTPQCVGVSHIDHSMTGRTHSQNQDGQVSENAQVLKIPKYCNLRKTDRNSA